MSHMTPLRDPAEETIDIYPGLVVHDSRQTGSITFGPTRLPVWVIFGELCSGGWESVVSNWPELVEYGWTQKRLASFLYFITEPRGELARLLLTLADVEPWLASSLP